MNVCLLGAVFSNLTDYIIIIRTDTEPFISLNIHIYIAENC